MQTPPPLHTELISIIRATRIRSVNEFRFAGRTFTISPADDETAEVALIRTLRDVLYGQTFCRTFGKTYRPFAQTEATDPTLAQSLAQANASQSRLDEGWCVEALQPTGQIAASKGNTTRAFWPGEFLLAEGEFGPPQPDTPIQVRWPKHTTTAQPGFYIAFGQAIADAHDEQSITRFYWNVRASGIVALMAGLTQQLNAHGIPFQFKCPLHPRNYARRDTAVLYVCQRHAQLALWLIQPIHAQLKAHLRADVPLYTQRLAAGLAWAQDPNPANRDESFGQHRSRLLAQGLWQAHQQQCKTQRQVLHCITQSFAASGLDLAQPHQPAMLTQTLRFSENLRVFSVNSSSPPNEFLEAATRIGLHLCAQAHWWGEQCNWLSDSCELAAGAWRVVHRTCGPEVYAGSSGIALFLGQLAARTGQPVLRLTAEGALRHALAHLDDVPATNRSSYYTGWPGIASVAHELSQCLNQPAWRAAAQHVVHQLQQQPLDEQECDLIGGYASAIPALISLHHAWADPSLIALATQFGDALMARAHKTKRGWAWPMTMSGEEQALCGLAHGTAGIGLALLVLHRATGAERFLQAAQASFRYERSWFSPKHGNWPDLRQTHPDTPQSKLSYGMVAWCHGAAGIGLSRLRAYELTQDQAWLSEIEAAAHTTLRWLQARETWAQASFCQCHGIAGNAAFLLAAGRALHRPAWREAALEAAQSGLHRYAERGLPWRCGVESSLAEVPGLMLGLAGVGAFYLDCALESTEANHKLTTPFTYPLPPRIMSAISGA